MRTGTTTRVIAVSSGKGGVGKTNVCVNLGLGLVNRGHAVMIMDADLGLANIDIMLGLRPMHDLNDVITGACTLEQVIVEGPGGLQIVPASSGISRMAGLDAVEHANLIRAFDELNGNIDVLLIDTAAGISESVINFSKACQEIIVVVCDEPASITDAYALIKVLNREHGVNRFKLLANMVNDIRHGRELYAKLAHVADEYLNVSLEYLGGIPLDPRLKEAVRAQQPVIEMFPRSSSGIAFQSLANRVEKMRARNSANGNIAFFLEREIRSQAVAGGEY